MDGGPGEKDVLISSLYIMDMLVHEFYVHDNDNCRAVGDDEVGAVQISTDSYEECDYGVDGIIGAVGVPSW